MRYLIALALLSMPAYAQQVYKCPGKDGVPVYQSEPCAQGSAQKTWDARQPVLSPVDQARIDRQIREAELVQQQRRQAQNSAVYYQPMPSGSTQAQSKHARCEAAKRERDAYLERRGLKRTHQELREWGDYVYERCKP